MVEVAVEGEDVARVELVGHGNEAGVGKIGGRVAIFVENLQNFWSAGSELKGYLEGSVDDILENVFRCAVFRGEQVA